MEDHDTPAADSRSHDPAAQQLYLLVIGEDTFAKYPLPAAGRLRIGRGENCEIRIEHALLSREHAVLEVGETIEIEDLGSRNGTTMFGEKLPSGARKTVLLGQAIELGAIMLIVQRTTPQPRRRRFETHETYRAALEDRSERARREHRPFSLLRIRTAEPAHVAELEVDLLAVYAPGEYEALLDGDDGTRAAQLAKKHARAAVAVSPRDGVTADLLLDRLAARLHGREQPEDTSSEGALIADAAMRDLYRVAERIAKGTISVLILGESGVGKEIFAEAIHRASTRRDGPLVRINCAALSDSLLESELFGHEKGAFTGAVKSKPGLLELAHGGSVFLDELGEIPPATQAKLLRVVEQRLLLRVGGTEPRRIDVRFLSATNRDLEAQVARGAFRQDLYFRLSGASLTIPPLRERIEEIEPLARRFVVNACRDLGSSSIPTISEAAIDLLEAHAWPGNIRELRNVIERAVLLCSSGELGPEHLPFERMSTSNVGRKIFPAEGDEERRIRAALEACAGNQTRAAAMLGMTRRMLTKRLDKYGMPRPKKR